MGADLRDITAKEEILRILQGRLDNFLNKGKIDRIEPLVTLIKGIKNNTITNYEYLESVGLEVTCEPCHHKLIEEQEDGSKIITHFKGGKQWVTYEVQN